MVSLMSQEKWDLNGSDDISCLFNTRDGECVIIGKILEQSHTDGPLLGLNKPISVDDLRMSEADELIVRKSVYRQFDIAGEFHYYFVTHTRP